MRDYEKELKSRVEFIKRTAAGFSGIVFGASGGKDSALVGILCKKACENTLGLIMPCTSKRNLEEDMTDAKELAKMFSIETRVLDLSPIKKEFVGVLGSKVSLTEDALANVAPRLRMAALYAAAASENRLVAGTGNRSEGYMGYFTKWGDGAFDFNPIADLTVTEIYEFLSYLKAPEAVIKKAPSAGLFEGQTDEGEMGITYKKIDEYILYNKATEQDKAKIEKYHKNSEHKRALPAVYKK
jgi:NAD+ synthase